MTERREDTVISKIKTWWKNYNMTPDEKYLSSATDMVDLEQRMKKLQHGLGPMGYYR